MRVREDAFFFYPARTSSPATNAREEKWGKKDIVVVHALASRCDALRPKTVY